MIHSPYYEILNDVLFVHKKQVILPAPVKKVLEVPDGLVILTTYKLNRNVFFVELNGNVRWEIQDCAPTRVGSRPYTNIWQIADKKILAGNAIGYDYLIDLDTGTISAYPPGAEQKFRPW